MHKLETNKQETQSYIRISVGFLTYKQIGCQRGNINMNKELPRREEGHKQDINFKKGKRIIIKTEWNHQNKGHISSNLMQQGKELMTKLDNEETNKYETFQMPENYGMCPPKLKGF